MKIKIVSNKKYSEMEASFGAKICYYDIDLEFAHVRAMAESTAGTVYIAAGCLEQAIQDIRTFQKVSRTLDRRAAK